MPPNFHSECTLRQHPVLALRYDPAVNYTLPLPIPLLPQRKPIASRKDQSKRLGGSRRQESLQLSSPGLVGLCVCALF